MAHEADWKRAGERRPQGMPVGLQSLGDVLPAAFRDNEHVELKDALSSAGLQYDVAIRHLKARRQAEGFGEQRIAVDVAKAAATCARLRKFCESPIEHMMVPWLVCQNYGQFSCGVPAAHVPAEDPVPPDAELMIVPQFAFARFRIDFALVAKIREHTKIVAIECDGRDYHKNAARDFRRDQYLLGWGIPTVRASGAEIARNPMHVGERVARFIVNYACDLGISP